MNPNNDLVDVTVSVPRDRLPDLYRLAASLNEAADGAPSSQGPVPWQERDTDIAARFRTTVSDNARKILDVLADLPTGETISGKALARAAGLGDSPYTVAGSLSSVGKAAVKFGRELPYRATPGETGESSTYEMPTHVADVFRAARAGAR